MSLIVEVVSARQDFVRLKTEIPIRYKFLCKVMDLDCDQIFEGNSKNISSKGCLLVGKVPSLSWIPGMLQGKILVGCNILLPSLDTPVKGLCRTAWIEAIPEGSDRCLLGLTFQDMTKENQDEIMKYIIKSQMTTK